ncbi:MAG: hypothetical protein SF069_12795 [Phycisphaerae bacterium]|nr:hypothetical protein [Phycisphaerae bacterium]
MPSATTTARLQGAQASRQQATRQRVSAKQWRLLRGAVLFVISLAVVLLVSMYNRDTLEVQADEARMRFWQQRFTAIQAQNDLAPMVLPLPPGQAPSLLDGFVYTRWFDLVALNRGGTAVVYRREPLRFFLRPAGRHIVVFDGRKFRIEWVAERDFAERAGAYGIDLKEVK